MNIMAPLIGEPKKSKQQIKRQTSLSDCIITHETLTQARQNLYKRSLEKKSTTLPHAGSKLSTFSSLPPKPTLTPPEKKIYADKPWFHNMSREDAMILIQQYGTRNNTSNDGFFLVRPSTSEPSNPLCLVLWYKDRVYNILIRRRKDARYALGSPKSDEQSFANVEDLVLCYKKEELKLFSNGAPSGSTRLVETPPRLK